MRLKILYYNLKFNSKTMYNMYIYIDFKKRHIQNDNISWIKISWIEISIKISVNIFGWGAPLFRE